MRRFPNNRQRLSPLRSDIRTFCLIALCTVTTVLFYIMQWNMVHFPKLEVVVSRITRKTNSEEKPLPSVILKNGLRMPRLGFGTAGLGPQTSDALKLAFSIGYRLVDSAQAREWYREDLVGKAIVESSVPRSDMFLVSKIHPRHLGFQSCLERIHVSLSDLKTHYLDLLLIHYPVCFLPVCDPNLMPPGGTWQQCWRAMEELYREGFVKAIGVSNFNEEELIQLLQISQIKPHVIQMNSDPLRANKAMQESARRHNVTFMGYSTLGSQWQFSGYKENPVLTHRTIIQISLSRNCTSAQVVLKWALSKGQVVIPRSSSYEHMVQNFMSPTCEIGSEDILAIDRIDGNFG